MKWTTWPYWLRGGVISGTVSIISFAAAISCLFGHIPFISGGFGLGCFLTVGLPWLYFYMHPTGTFIPDSVIVGVALYFVIGSLIGAFVGVTIKKSSN